MTYYIHDPEQYFLSVGESEGTIQREETRKSKASVSFRCLFNEKMVPRTMSPNAQLGIRYCRLYLSSFGFQIQISARTSGIPN